MQRIAYLYESTEMKSVMWGGEKKVWRMVDEDEYSRNLAMIMILPGTPVRITRIERQNLIDSGTLIAAHGFVRKPGRDTETEFVYELTVKLGYQIRRAPWEDNSIPAIRDNH